VFLLGLFFLFSIPGRTQEVLGQASDKASGQTDSLVQLADFLKQIRQEKQVSFLYETGVVRSKVLRPPANLQRPLRQILQDILPGLGLEFIAIDAQNYIIKPEGYSVETLADKKAVRLLRGQLINGVSAEPLPGGSIQLPGLRQGTISDEQGFFQLELSADVEFIRISYLGFKTEFVDVRDRNQVTVQLTPLIAALDEVVISALGIPVARQKLAYAHTERSTEALAISGEANLVNALRGQVPGLWAMSSSGSPGAMSSMVIRGFSSITGNNAPLIVLNGMPVDNHVFGGGSNGIAPSNRLIDLNPHDIASVSVLKGASAAALYGIRAANGVIVLNTRRGSPEQMEVRYSSSIGVQLNNQLPPRQNEYAQGIFREGKAVYMGPESRVNSSYGPPLHSLVYDGASDYPYDQHGRLVPASQYDGQPARTYDPYETFFVPGWTQDHHLQLSGGRQDLTYYLGMGYFRQTGTSPYSSFKRLSLKGVFDLALSDRMTLSWQTHLSQSGGNRFRRGSMLSGIPLGLFRTPPSFDIGNGLRGKRAADAPSSYLLADGSQRAYRGNSRYDNPFWAINRNPFSDAVMRTLQQLTLTYQWSPQLKLTYRAGGDIYSDRREDAFDRYSGTHPRGYLEEQDLYFAGLNTDVLLQWQQHWGDSWTLDALAGYNAFYSLRRSRRTMGEELRQPGIFQMSNAVSVHQEEAEVHKLVTGVFADARLTYQDWLTLNVTARNDWSSSLEPGYNRFFYPGAGLSVQTKQWLPTAWDKTISSLRLRASIAQVGNDAAPYLTNTYYQPGIVDGDYYLPGTQFPAYGVSGMERSDVKGNKMLRAERAQTVELGTEASFWSNRLTLDVSWFYTKNSGQILESTLPAPSGFLRKTINAGSILNRGWEAAATLDWLNGEDLQAQTRLVFTRFNSLVADLPADAQGISLAAFSALSSVVTNNEPYGVLIGTSYKRNENGRRIIGYDGFPLVSEQQQIVGDPNPDWLLGLQQHLAWKRWSLDLALDVKAGGDLWNGTRGVMNYLGISRESGEGRTVTDYVFSGVTPDGEENNKAVALADPAAGMRGIYWRRYGFLGLAEAQVEDASWVKIRSLGIHYTLPLSLWDKGKRRLRIGGMVRNLILWTPYSGIDPETSLRSANEIMGWDYFNSPGVRSLECHIDLVF